MIIDWSYLLCFFGCKIQFFFHLLHLFCFFLLVLLFICFIFFFFIKCEPFYLSSSSFFSFSLWLLFMFCNLLRIQSSKLVLFCFKFLNSITIFIHHINCLKLRRKKTQGINENQFFLFMSCTQQNKIVAICHIFNYLSIHLYLIWFSFFFIKFILDRRFIILFCFFIFVCHNFIISIHCPFWFLIQSVLCLLCLFILAFCFICVCERGIWFWVGFRLLPPF